MLLQSRLLIPIMYIRVLVSIFLTLLYILHHIKHVIGNPCFIWYLTSMTTNNSKHTIANSKTQMNQSFVLLVELINAVFGIATISSHATTKSPISFFVYVKFLEYSPILESLFHSQTHILEFHAKSSLHIWF